MRRNKHKHQILSIAVYPRESTYFKKYRHASRYTTHPYTPDTATGQGGCRDVRRETRDRRDTDSKRVHERTLQHLLKIRSSIKVYSTLYLVPSSESLQCWRLACHED